MLQIHILTIFPEMFSGPFSESILKRARDNKLIEIHLHNLRDWTNDSRKTVDDKPFGGGPGMIMMIEPIYKALKDIKGSLVDKNYKTLVTAAAGTNFTQQKATEYSNLDALIIICGHYEGIDYRVIEHLADEEISIGDYVLTGGELPAMVITDAVARLIPGVLGNEESLETESHNQQGQTEAPQFTRPAEFSPDLGEAWVVPDVLLSGNHAEIEKWRKQNQKIKN